jgi:hypothetical protein
VGSGGTNCQNPQNPGGGVCEINTNPTGCTNNCYDIDGLYSTGCECCDDGNSKSCGGGYLGSLGVNSSSIINVTGKLPSNSEADWFYVNFTGNGDINFHPHVSIGGDTGIVFSVYGGCGGTPLGCLDGSAQGVIAWDEYYDMTQNPKPDPNSKAQNGTSNFIAIAPVAGTGTIYIKVFRANGNPTCNQFTLTVSNQ